MTTRGKVIVRSKNILSVPLLESADANMVEFHDRNGNLIAFFARIFNDDTWGLCTQADPDWPEMCVRYGFSTLRPGAGFSDVVKDGVRPFIAGVPR